jgi:hypothetical protein
MSNNTGGPAFPYTEANCAISGDVGMTLRDYFAAKAMQAIIASEQLGDEEFVTPEMYARDAYKYADAMLKARGA